MNLGEALFKNSLVRAKSQRIRFEKTDKPDYKRLRVTTIDYILLRARLRMTTSDYK